MALQYVGGTKATGASADYAVSLTSLTGGLASSPSAGDLVIVATGFVTSAVDGNPGVTTTGYTELCDLYETDSSDSNLSVNWKIMSGTPDTSVTVKGSADATWGASTVVHVWRGADQSTPIDVTTTTATGQNGSVPDSPSITPVTNGVIVLSIGHTGGSAPRGPYTAPTGYTNALTIDTDPGRASTSVIASKAWSGSGAEDPAAWTYTTTSGVDCWTAATVAIRPFAITFSISETLSLTESTSNLRTRLFSTSETLSLTENLTALKGLSFSVSESLGLVEAYSILHNMIFTIADSLGLVEVLAQVRKRWEDIIKNSSTFTNDNKSSASSFTDTNKSSSTWTETDKS